MKTESTLEVPVNFSVICPTLPLHALKLQVRGDFLQLAIVPHTQERTITLLISFTVQTQG